MVSSPLDDATKFFQSKSLSDRASDLNDKKDNIDQAISSVSAALEAIDAVDTIVRQLKGLAISAKTATGTELTDVVTQYNDLNAQINLLTADASYQGLNLVNATGSTLTVSFSNLTTSILSIASVDLTNATTGLSITSAVNFSLTSLVDAASRNWMPRLPPSVVRHPHSVPACSCCRPASTSRKNTQASPKRVRTS